MHRTISAFAPRTWIIAGAAVVALAGAANAAPDLVLNGNFAITTLSGSYGFGDLYPTNQVADWSTSGYNFVFAPNTADSTGATGEYGFLSLWGPGNGSANGFTATAPSGGNFIGADGAYQVGAISQTITGLTVGEHYNVSFDWAGAQQSGYYSGTTENWTVSLGDESHATFTAHNASQGFTGWFHDNMVFTATDTTEVLSFLAHGTPNGVPPFSLLDGVSLSAVPEPAAWALMLVGIGGLGAVLRTRRRAAAAAA